MANMDFSNHLVVNTALDVDKICEPLYKLGITLFLFLRIYSAEERIFLSNNPGWNEQYLTNYYKLLYFKNHFFEETLQNNVLILPESVSLNPAFKVAREMFGYDNGFVLNIPKKDCKEICYFASKQEKLFTDNFYMQHLDLLERFVNYFKEKAKPFIDLADKARLKTPQEYLDNMKSLITQAPSFKLPANARENFSIATQADRYYLLKDKQNRYLTNKEYECIQWLIKGKSSEEAGMIMGLSKRTVEKYLENAKERFTCVKLPQLVYYLTKLGAI